MSQDSVYIFKPIKTQIFPLSMHNFLTQYKIMMPIALVTQTKPKADRFLSNQVSNAQNRNNQKLGKGGQETWNLYMTIIYTAHMQSSEKGSVFSRVCHSVCSGRGSPHDYCGPFQTCLFGPSPQTCPPPGPVQTYSLGTLLSLRPVGKWVKNLLIWPIGPLTPLTQTYWQNRSDLVSWPWVKTSVSCASCARDTKT